MVKVRIEGLPEEVEDWTYFEYGELLQSKDYMTYNAYVIFYLIHNRCLK